MALQLPIPFTPEVAPTWKYKLEQADNANVKTGADVIVGSKLPTQARKSRLILFDENNAPWSITVDSTGALHATKVTL